LKDTERRADRWKAEFGVEQTEVDALATLRPNDLRRVVERGLAPCFDVTLQSRIESASREWRDQAQAVIDEHVDPEELAEIEDNVDTMEEETTERIARIKEETPESRPRTSGCRRWSPESVCPRRRCPKSSFPKGHWVPSSFPPIGIGPTRPAR
jgi:hypothetical protein